MPGCTRRVVLTLPAVFGLQAQPVRTLSTRLLEAARDSVVVLAVLSKTDQVLRTAMGFQLDDSADFITSSDAMRDAAKVIILTTEGRRYAVETVLLDSGGSGLARLTAKLPEYARRGVTSTSNVATEDDPVQVPCLTREGQHLLAEGTIAAFRSSLDFGPYYRVLLKPPANAVIEPALPVLNMAGELIGVLTRRLLARRNLFYVVPARRLPTRREMPPALPRSAPSSAPAVPPSAP